MDPVETLISGIGEVFGFNFSNAEAEQRERIARQENYQYNEASANAADARTRRLYEDLQSPKALLEQYKQAGLSPSLMFGGGGIGGQTAQGVQGEGASGISPNTYGLNPLEAAQTALTLAEADKVKEETSTIKATREPTVNKLVQDTATSLSQEGLNKASEKLTLTNEAIASIEQFVAEATISENIATITAKASEAAANAEAAWEEVDKAKRQNKFDEQTFETRVKQLEANVTKTITEIALNRQQKQLTYWETKKVKNEITKIWWDASYACEQLKLQKIDTDIKKQKLNVEIEKWIGQVQMTYDQMGAELSKEAMRDITNIFRAYLYAGAITSPKTKTTETYNPNGTSRGWTIENIE